MTSFLYNVVLALCVAAGLFGLYVADTPHPAAIVICSLCYMVIMQNITLDRLEQVIDDVTRKLMDACAREEDR